MGDIFFTFCSVPISSLVMFFIQRYKEPQIDSTNLDEDSSYSEKKLFDRPETPTKIIRVLYAFWYTLYVIFETVFFKFAVTYFQYCPQRLTAQKAAEVFSISSAVYTAFRGVNILIGLKVKRFYILSYHYGFLIIGMALQIVGQYNYIVLWTSSIVLCFGFSAMFAGIFAFTGQYLTLTDRLSTFFTLIRGLFTLFTPLVIGYFIEDYSMIFIIINLFYLISSLIIFISIVFLIKRYSRILKVKENES